MLLGPKRFAGDLAGGRGAMQQGTLACKVPPRRIGGQSLK